MNKQSTTTDRRSGRAGIVQAGCAGLRTVDELGQIEEVVVTGIRGSLRESLETKREAVGVVDALTAEDVGKFPDKNLAEALQRVPGIVISREFGEGERVSLRGTEPQPDAHAVERPLARDRRLVHPRPAETRRAASTT